MVINISVTELKVTGHGKGMDGRSSSSYTLYVGNNGTTMRLITGLLNAKDFNTKITGESTIQKRPMNRV